MKKSMKTTMNNIMNETKVEKFVELSETYLRELQNANELEYLNYLKRYVCILLCSNENFMYECMYLCTT